ncbi:MAG: low-specificity L-threonine aldolase [Synergistetes bacterium]|nr:low-specificity L-threonine aldolase [Synergistota bacterium]MDW8192058.1 low-specificity L-threonine aldolase [Synergistota bacterium]
MKVIDLRSDTVTTPTDEMREAMMKARVGDDVYREDPTVNELEELAASIFKKEAALFVVSGTMANQVSVMTYTQRGDEIVVGKNSHIYNYEVGAIAALSGVQVFPLNDENGMFNLSELEEAIRPENIHFPRTALITLENTHNRAGGTALSKEYIDEVANIANKYDIPLYLDGARIFNACIALGIEPAKMVERVDALMFCLSKGLSAPIGSVIVGRKDFIEKARKMRKRLGGGMRQAGVIAACGIVALTKMIERLKEDHENAEILAKKLSEVKGIIVEPVAVRTNMVYFMLFPGIIDAYTLAKKLLERGIKISVVSKRRVRLVTHKDVTREDVIEAAEAIKEVVESSWQGG